MTTWYGGNNYLTMEQMTVNAQYILNYLLARGWTKNAICGMLGNMQTESNINPQIWENLTSGDTSKGYGLVQWTPATKLIDWCNLDSLDYTQMDSQLLRILYEVSMGLQWDYTPMTFEEYTHSLDSANSLAMVFLQAYEKPLNPDQPIRGEQANYWYNNLTGTSLGSYVKLIFPYWFNSIIKISYSVNRFKLMYIHGNVALIKNENSNRLYYVNKSSIKTI